MYTIGPDGKIVQVDPNVPSYGTGQVKNKTVIDPRTGQPYPVGTNPYQPTPPTQVPQVTPSLPGPGKPDPTQGDSGSFSPFDVSSIPRTGAYGESVALKATDYLSNLRKALDAGKLSVTDFLKLGQPAAETAFKEIQSIGGKGSSAANLVNPLLGTLQGAGFVKGDDGVIRPKLPDQYNQEQIKNALPTNLTDQQKSDLISQLPPGLDPNSDQGKVEIENLRERAQQQATLTQQQGLRDQAITGLQGIIGQQQDIRNQGIPALQKSLEDEANRQFSLDQPGIYEDLNSRGLLRSSALGDRLAQQKSLYAGDVANRIGQIQFSNTQQSADDLNKLAAARLASSDADVQAIQQGLLNSNQLQQSGVSRQFGLQDFATQANMARQIALMSQGQGGGGGGGGLSGALAGAGGGAMTAASLTKNPAIIAGSALAGGAAGSQRGK